MGFNLDSQVLVALIGSTTTVLVAGGGWWFAWRIHRESKVNERQQERFRKVAKELLARVVLERKANEWIAELNGTTPRKAMLELRERVEKELRYRPEMSEREIRTLLEIKGTDNISN